jgi:hypothetical protein
MSGRALIVDGDSSRRDAACQWLRSLGYEVIETAEADREGSPLRDRSPDFYKEIQRRYEEGIKLVLQHRIYKMGDDAFEPFREIAKELFLANATARDVIELHYHTLRKIAPTPDAPRAQAYLEVGRTTIIGLLGDLLTCYRDAGNEHDKQGCIIDGQWPKPIER